MLKEMVDLDFPRFKVLTEYLVIELVANHYRSVFFLSSGRRIGLTRINILY